jgi:hypothetical protein
MVVDNRRDRGSLVTDSEVRLMVAASNALLAEVADAWGLARPSVAFAGDIPGGVIPDNAYQFHMIGEDANVPDALAYHTEEGGKVDGFVLTRAILTNGGVPLCDPKKPLTTPTVASALFHELAEAFVDPTVNIWWQDQNGIFYSAEICDPVQGNNVLVDVTLADTDAAGAKTGPSRVCQVALSDFVYPAWRDSEAADDGSTQMNFTDTLKAPFTLDHGGYFVKYDPVTDSHPQQVFGRRVVAWMRALKAASGRYARRTGGFGLC